MHLIRANGYGNDDSKSQLNVCRYDYRLYVNESSSRWFVSRKPMEMAAFTLLQYPQVHAGGHTD